MPKILIAGGGSGGHVAPAIAAGESLVEQGASVLLAHSTRKIDKDMLEPTSFDSVAIPACPLVLNPIGFTKFCVGFWKTSKKVRTLIRENEITCVLATGGFVAAPALLGARKEGCRTVLLNLDDPPGKANKLAVRWADTILSTVNCALERAVLIPPPLRKCVITAKSSKECKQQFGLDPNKMTLFVTGASQGASTMNELLPELANLHSDAFRGWEVLHIAGSKHVDNVTRLWNEIGVPCKVLGFTQEMGSAWGAADLAITRGGANTIAEIAMNTVPSIVLPYPYHQDNHQRTNAEPLEQLGGVQIVQDQIQLGANLQDAGSIIVSLMHDHQARFSMRQAMINQPARNGAACLATACLH
jgi:UDP-N-acetylglucosamine--N-acetylmuramyl-(pentapeptide) pyrophosphoryl-undecaprenol N-acetylglucosamine transferase